MPTLVSARRSVLILAAMAAFVMTASPARGADSAAVSTVRDSGALMGVTDSTRDSTAIADSIAAATPPPPPDYIAQVRAGFTPDSRAYATTQAALGIIDPIYAILVNLFLLFSGLAGRMRDVAKGLGHRRYVHVLIFLVLYSVFGLVLSFPLAWYEGFALEHRYGLSNQSLGSWLGDLGKGELLVIGLFGLVPIVKLAYDAIERHRRTWGLWLAMIAIPVIVTGALIEPVLIDPVFNHFTPLGDQRLKGEILALAERAGIPASNVYVVNKSAQTKKFNAYVNGIGASQRIVLWDTTLHGMRDDEILFVMGHEMGHYRLHHVWKGLGLESLLWLVLFTITAVLATRAMRRFSRRWRFDEMHDVASIPLIVLTISFLALLAQPLANAVTREFEHEADIYALELTHANDAGARAFIALASQNRSDPEPPAFVELTEYTHPPLIERIRFALGYHPWDQGEPNQLYEPESASP